MPILKYFSRLVVSVGLLIFSSISQANTVSFTPRPSIWATPINAKANLYQVTPQLYRSEQLLASDVNLLEANHIDTIVNLRFFDRDDDSERLANQGFKLVNFPLLTWSIKPKQLAKILIVIEDEQAQGKTVLVHCYHGADRTGVTIAMYRIIHQGWTVEQAKAEMVQGGYGYHAIWKNINDLLTEQKVAQVKTAYAMLKKDRA